jgi:hypothetical protein
MRIGKRLFPYPVINCQKIYSQFTNSDFSFQYDEEITEDNEFYVLKNLQCHLTDENLINLINEGKAEATILIECASTMIRTNYSVPLTPVDIKIPLADLNGKVNISAFVVAKEDIHHYKSDNFIPDYSSYEFEIEKNDILAVDDGYINDISFNDQDDNKNSSIFIVIKDMGIKDGTMQIDYDSAKIQIALPEKQWNMYDKTKRISQYQSLYFSIVAIPALTYALTKLQNSNDPSVEMIRMDYKWFDSFAEAYKKIHGEELDDDAFIKMNANLEAQIIMNAPVTAAIERIFDDVITMKGDDEDGD